MELWDCPECRRKFARHNQSHSCVSVSVDDHFRGKAEELRGTFDRLVEGLKQSGPVRVDAVKSAINLADRFHFAMIYIHRDSLTVEFALDRQLAGPRILRTTKPCSKPGSAFRQGKRRGGGR